MVVRAVELESVFVVELRSALKTLLSPIVAVPMSVKVARAVVCVE